MKRKGKAYSDRELQHLLYSVINNPNVKGENLLLAKEFGRTPGAICQEKIRIKRVLLGNAEDGRISQAIHRYGARVRRPKTERVKREKKVSTIDRFLGWLLG